MVASIPSSFWYRPMEVRKQAVYYNEGLRKLQGKPPLSPKASGLFCCGGLEEASQDQIMVYVVVGVLERHVLENTKLLSYKVVYI